MEIIVPAAGLSTRFPDTKPKYILTDYKGKMMLYSSIFPFLGKNKITIGILKEHDEKFNIKKLLKHEFGNNISIVILDSNTSGPAETVYQIIKKSNIKKTDEIFIKDCDSFFEHNYLPGNYICLTTFCKNNIIRKAKAKSYVMGNENGIIQKIVEKEIISNKFCVGGYKFESSEIFCNSFESISNINGELFISNVIQNCLLNGSIFLENIVENYIDVGTIEEWIEFNNKVTIFCDIDGTLIKAQPKNEYHLTPIALENNVNKLKKMLLENNEIIFTTARPESERINTQKMLDSLGFSECKLLMGLYNSRRVLINDFNNANPYPRAVAINIQRDNDTIERFL